MIVKFTTPNLGANAGEFMLDTASARILIKALEIKAAADEKWPAPNSLHEGYGLLREEFAEFEEQVFLKQSKRDQDVVSSELADIITVCLRTASVDILK